MYCTFWEIIEQVIAIRHFRCGILFEIKIVCYPRKYLVICTSRNFKIPIQSPKDIWDYGFEGERAYFFHVPPPPGIGSALSSAALIRTTKFASASPQTIRAGLPGISRGDGGPGRYQRSAEIVTGAVISPSGVLFIRGRAIGYRISLSKRYSRCSAADGACAPPPPVPTRRGCVAAASALLGKRRTGGTPISFISTRACLTEFALAHWEKNTDCLFDSNTRDILRANAV